MPCMWQYLSTALYRIYHTKPAIIITSMLIINMLYPAKPRDHIELIKQETYFTYNKSTPPFLDCKNI